jgi:CRISPR-associated protein Csx14
MVKLVATLGTTPGGILETFLYLRKKDSRLNEIVVITTSHESVRKAYDILVSMFLCCIKERPKSNVIIKKIELDIDDITSSDDLDEFMNKINGVVEEGDYVDITGGRKGMSVAASIVAINKKAKVFTSIIPQDEYKEISNKLFKKDIKTVTNEKDCGEEEKEFFCSLISKNARTFEFHPPP